MLRAYLRGGLCDMLQSRVVLFRPPAFVHAWLRQVRSALRLWIANKTADLEYHAEKFQARSIVRFSSSVNLSE